MDLSSTFISSCIQCCCLFKYLKTAPRSDPGHCLYSEYFWEKQLQFALHCFAHLMLSPRRKSSTASEVQDTDTHTHTYKYNRLSFKSKNPPEINMAIESNPKPSCLRQQATPLSTLVAILVGVLVGLLVRWLLRCWLIATILGWIINRR